jgi:hypothetical protein
MNDRLAQATLRKENGRGAGERDCQYVRCATSYDPSADDFDTHEDDDDYCSPTCSYRATARTCIEGVRRDHKFCGTCHRSIKELVRMGRVKFDLSEGKQREQHGTPVPSFATAEQFYDHRTDGGIGEVLFPSDGPGSEPEATDFKVTRAICWCYGRPTHHSTVHDFDTLSRRDALKRGRRLLDALSNRKARRKCREEWSDEVFIEYIRKCKTDPDAHVEGRELFEQALGLALQHPNAT